MLVTKWNVLYKFSCLLLSILALQSSPAQAGTICPKAETVFPCECHEWDWAMNGAVHCHGLPETERHTPYNVLSMVLQRNGMSLGGPEMLNLEAFYLTNTTLEWLNLDLLHKFRLQRVVIYNNTKVTEIDGPLSDLISTKILDLVDNEFRNQMLSNLLNFVDPEALTQIDLKGNALQLIELQKFHKLSILDLSYNRIFKVGGGQFLNNSRLTVLHLNDNHIDELGENSFLFNPPDEDMKDETLFIYLMNNNLTQQKIHPNLGLESVGRPTELFIDLIDFDTLAEEPFAKFLTAHPSNKLHVTGNENGFMCDERIHWILQKRHHFQERIDGTLSCRNDPGQNIFTSKLIRYSHDAYLYPDF